MTTPNNPIEPLLTEKEVAKLLQRLGQRSGGGDAPGKRQEWIKLNASVRYRYETVRQFIAAQERSLTSADLSDKAVRL